MALEPWGLAWRWCPSIELHNLSCNPGVPGSFSGYQSNTAHLLYLQKGQKRSPALLNSTQKSHCSPTAANPQGPECQVPNPGQSQGQSKAPQSEVSENKYVIFLPPKCMDPLNLIPNPKLRSLRPVLGFSLTLSEAKPHPKAQQGKGKCRTILCPL